MSNLQQSALFNASDADVIFRSADNVLFNIHRKNLEVTTGAFPPSDFSTQDESVALSESSTTLRLMFQYIYPMPQPEAPSLPFETLAPLAEAVEKYQVFPAMVICRVQMRKFLSQHAPEIVGYAEKHGYKDIVADAAPLLLAMPLEEVVARLPANIVAPWALYYGAWNRVLRSARSFPLQSRISSIRIGRHSPVVSGQIGFGDCVCDVDKQICSILMALHDIDSLQNLATIFTSRTTSCTNVASSLNEWRQAIETEIKNIKPFITYL